MKNRLLACAGIATLLLIGSAVGGAIVAARRAEASRNSSGSYTLYSPGNPAVTNQLISTSLWNNTFGDIATELSDSLSRSGKGGMTAPLRTADGVVGTPSWSWTSETGTGYYRIGAGDLGLSILGTKTGEWTANGLRVADGALATPSLSFFNDTGSGLYRIGSNDLGFAVNGTRRQEWTTTGSSITGTLALSDVFTQSVSGTGSTFLANFFEASLANGNSGTLAVGKANSANSSVGLQFNPNATAANSTGCLVVNGQTGTLCVDGNNAVTASGTFKVGTGSVSTVSGFSRGGCTLNGGSPATCTATVVSGQTCTASFGGTTAPPASGLRTNNAAGTLTIYGANGSTEGANYTCF